MSNQEIEALVLRVARNVKEGRPVEDSRVELKSEWPDPDKAARQLAAQLNAARRGDVFWLIGLDEKRGVIGAAREEMATWFPKVQAQFEGLKPTVIDLNVPFSSEGKEIVALMFRSDRAPYVVNIAGTDKLEVPWREGSRTRSAKREELLSTVVEFGREPEVEVMRLDVEANTQGGSSSWNISIRFYMVPTDDQRVVIPYHRCSAIVQFKTWGQLAISGGSFSGKPNDSIKLSGTEAIVSAAGMLHLNFKATSSTGLLPDNEPLEVRTRLDLVRPHMPVGFAARAESILMQGNPNTRLWSFHAK